MMGKGPEDFNNGNGAENDIKVNMNEFQTPPMPFLLDYGFRPPLMGNDVWLTPDQASWSFHAPIIGRIRIVKDPVGSLFAFFILFFWIYNVGCVFYLILLPRYDNGSMSMVLLIMFGVLAFLCVSSFIKASITNPGALSSTEIPGSDWNVCLKCKMNRPPGTHHCRRCGQCVKKMDHHCPWINNCVGEENQNVFMLLLLYAYILSVFTLILDVCSLYDFLPCYNCPELTVFGFGERKLLWASLGMAIFMTCSSLSLFLMQHFAILFELPSMEFNRMQMDFIFNKRLPVVWPSQKKSTSTLYRKTCGQGFPAFWLLPCHKRRPSPSYLRERLV